MKCWFNGTERDIQAEWPVIPNSTDDGTVENLAEFPDGTLFYEINVRDSCSLFVADKLPPSGTIPLNYHYVAVWHEHMIFAVKNNMVENVVVRQDRPITPLGYFLLTDTGHRAAIISRLTAEMSIWPLFGSVRTLLYQGRYGNAVREACTRLEHRIREISGASSKIYGTQLISVMIERAPAAVQLQKDQLQQIEAAYRRFFAFVRNDFAHNMRELDLATAIVLIARSSSFFNFLDTRLGYPRDETLFDEAYGQQ